MRRFAHRSDTISERLHVDGIVEDLLLGIAT
jgi:hypothetical protein